MKTHEITLLLGGNIGDTRGYIRNALGLLEHRLGHLTHQSYFYKTASWGFDSTDFINLAISLETKHSAEKCLEITQEVEAELGRHRFNRAEDYTDRTIDIDILFYGSEIIESDKLSIPHPRLHLRNFALEPLAEIMPDFVHPVLHQNMLELKDACSDESKVTKLNEQI
jgi:2-amino-4-hydroxy-6-hydroxymethyldihydropteridine diphosphokinase